MSSLNNGVPVQEEGGEERGGKAERREAGGSTGTRTRALGPGSLTPQ